LLLIIYFNQTQIPGYSQFAFQGRNQAKQIRESRTVNQITALNDATKNLVSSLQGQIVSLNNSFASYKRTSEENLANLTKTNQLLAQQLQELPRQLGLALAGAGLQQPINPPTPANPPRPPPGTVASPGASKLLGRPYDVILKPDCIAIKKSDALAGPAIFFNQMDCDVYCAEENNATSASFNRVTDAIEYLFDGAIYHRCVADGDMKPAPAAPPAAPPTAPPTAPAMAPRAAQAAAPRGNYARDARAELLRTNALGFLGGRHNQPVVDKAALPSSWTAILNEWRLLNFETFRHLDMKEWEHKQQKTRYIKRRSAMEEIERFRATHALDTLDRAAKSLDRQKTINSCTMNQHLDRQRNSNPGVAKRAQSANGRQRVPAPPRRRSQVARIARELLAPPAPAPAAAVVYPRSNHSQGQRIQAEIIQRQNDLLLRQAREARMASLPARADVLLPGYDERVRDSI
jgi:hypothetical protein